MNIYHLSQPLEGFNEQYIVISESPERAKEMTMKIAHPSWVEETPPIEITSLGKADSPKERVILGKWDCQ